MNKGIRTALMVIVSLGLISAAFAGDACGGNSAGCKGKGSCNMAGMHSASEAKAGSETVPYVLNKCIVSGEKLGGMGDPVVKVYDGREVKFCCNGCVGKFEKDKASYFKKIDEALIADQKPNYPLTTCVVSGEKLGGGQMTPVDYVYHNQLVRFCCAGCINTFEKDPAKYLSMLTKDKPADKPDAKTEVKTETKTETTK